VRAPSGALSFLLQDQINSTVYALDAYANELASRGYYAFGATRTSEGVMPTDHRFTGQQEDGTGLYNYNSRFYDPQIGNFISPPYTLAPDCPRQPRANCCLHGFRATIVSRLE
jgi:RHS repeat-associated protein